MSKAAKKVCFGADKLRSQALYKDCFTAIGLFTEPPQHFLGKKEDEDIEIIKKKKTTQSWVVLSPPSKKVPSLYPSRTEGL